MKEMIEFLDGREPVNIEFYDVLVRRLVEKVTIFDEYITVKFKSGIEIEIQN